MAKITLSDVSNLSNEPAALAAINANSAAIETAIENTLSRDGTTPNEMNANLDMNSYKVQNLPTATTPTEPIRKQEFDDVVGPILDASTGIYAALEAAVSAATSATTSAQLASTHLDGVEVAVDEFFSVYLGAFTIDPTTDNNGGPLASGMFYLNTAGQAHLRFYSGGWQTFPLPNSFVRRQHYVATAGQTTFTVSGGYTGGFALVTYNGIQLTPGVDVNIDSGTDFVLSVGASEGTELSFYAFGTFNVADVLSASSNLADVPNVITARTNLGAASKTEVDTLVFQQGRLNSVSGSVIRLDPYQGNKLTINGVARTIPTAGVSLTAAALTTSTVYYIYAYWNGSTIVLEPSTTVPAVDATYGIKVKTGDATRTLVGQAYANSATTWLTNTATSVGVLSWLNQLSAGLVNVVSGGTTTSASFTNISATLGYFLTWTGNAISYTLSGRGIHSAANGNSLAIGAVDGAALGEYGQCVAIAATGAGTLGASGNGTYAEGTLHSFQIFGAQTGGTATFHLKMYLNARY